MHGELSAGPVTRAEVHGLITPEEMRRWRQASGLRLAVDLIGPWFQIGAAIAASALLPHLLVLVLAFLVIAGALHGVTLHHARVRSPPGVFRPRALERSRGPVALRRAGRAALPAGWPTTGCAST